MLPFGVSFPLGLSLSVTLRMDLPLLGVDVVDFLETGDECADASVVYGDAGMGDKFGLCLLDPLWYRWVSLEIDRRAGDAGCLLDVVPLGMDDCECG